MNVWKEKWVVNKRMQDYAIYLEELFSCMILGDSKKAV
jgi:hypothetical protein